MPASTTGYGRPPTMYPSPPPSQGNLPWNFNTTNAPGSLPSVMPSRLPGSTGTGYPVPANASGVVPYASPPYPANDPQPLFVLSSEGKRFLFSLLVAAVLGFVPLPWLYWPLLAMILLGYVLLTQSVKTWLLRKGLNGAP